jgi:hypothetical protein
MRRLWGSCAVALSIMVFAPAAWADDDVVLLKNGGRVRGTVIQEDPVQGVRVRLPDGTIRAVKPAEVKQVLYADAAAAPTAKPAASPAAPPASAGAIHVEVDGPAGRVTVDGGAVGRTPADVKAAGVGRHLVQIDFDDGGTWRDTVLVQAGETSNVKLGEPQRRSTGMMVSGIVVTGIATVLLVAGLALVTQGESCYSNALGFGCHKNLPPTVYLAPISVALAAVGIPLWVVGARSTRAVLARNAPPTWVSRMPHLSIAVTYAPPLPLPPPVPWVPSKSAALIWSF